MTSRGGWREQRRTRRRDQLHWGTEPNRATAIGRLFFQRSIAVALLALGALISPEYGALVAALSFGLGSLANVLGLWQSRRLGKVTPVVHIIDLTVILTVLLVEPEVLDVALMMLLAVVALAATVSGRIMATAVTLLCTAGLTFIHLREPFSDPATTILGFAITGALIGGAAGRLADLEARLRGRLTAVVNDLDAVLWVRSLDDHRYLYVNESATELLGWDLATWTEPGFWHRNVHPDDLERATETLERAAAEGEDFELTYRLRAADGRWVHLHDRVSVGLDGSGRATVLQGLSLDVSDRVDIENQVQQYADIVHRIDQALLVLQLTDGEPGEPAVLRLTGANPAAERLMRRTLHPMVGATIEEVFPSLAGSKLVDRLQRVAVRGTPLRVDDLIVHPEDGTPRVVVLRAFPLPDRSTALSLTDVTDAVEASEALRRQALYDGLTGLPNRRLFDQELHRAVREAPVHGGQVALLVMDLDQFKEVNDALGHHVGDRLLRSIGDRLTAAFDTSMVARLGGDEFALVLAENVDEEGARKVATEVRNILAEPVVLDDVRLQSNASIGIALYPTHATEVATLIQRADVAMYVAKRSGTGFSVYNPEHDRSSVKRLTLIGDLPGAVAHQQFELHFQPCIDLRTGRPVRAEALLRWNHPRLGRVPPDQFIELAELSGAIQPLTHWVVDESLRAARRWRDAGFDLDVAVNISVRNLYDPELVPHIALALQQNGLNSENLVLELTESGVMDDPGLAREVFAALGDLGVGTAIDDFGTGYSSLTFLRDLPLREIKIDRSFVAGMHRRSEEFTIVRSMIDLGHNLGLEVVAEGAEHADDLQLLRRLGCDLAQGFHLSRPLPQDDVLPWLISYAETAIT